MMKIYIFNMNIVVDYETMAEGLHKALSSTNLKELRDTLIILAGYIDGARFSAIQKAYKERMKWQFQDITISIETNPTSRSE